MPRGDRTGPMGMGPMTGRAAGYCAGFGAPGYVNPGPGWGRGYGPGWGRGFGGGWGHGYRWRTAGWPGRYYGAPRWFEPAGPWGAWQITREEEVEYLKGQADMLRQELDAISARIGQIESEQRSGAEGEE